MPKTFSPAKFADPDSVFAVRIDLLQRLLKRHKLELRCDRAFSQCESEAEQSIHALLTAPQGLPCELVDDLALMHELATSRNYDVLLEAARRHGITIDEDPSVGDLAVLLLLEAPHAAARIHAECFTTARRKFENFPALCGVPPQRIGVSEAEADLLAKRIGEEFTARRLGGKVAVFVIPNEHGFTLVIRRGESLARETVLNEQSGEPGSISFRPVRYDLVEYSVIRGELRVNTRGMKNRELYLRAVGDVVFGDPTLFFADGVPRVFVLDTLADRDPLSITTDDVPELASAKLCCVESAYPGSGGHTLAVKGPDVVGVLRAHQQIIPRGSVFLRARFRLTFRSGRTITVWIDPPNGISVSRPSDRAVVERWLELRGFMVSREEALYGITHSLLASA